MQGYQQEIEPRPASFVGGVSSHGIQCPDPNGLSSKSARQVASLSPGTLLLNLRIIVQLSNSTSTDAATSQHRVFRGYSSVGACVPNLKMLGGIVSPSTRGASKVAPPPGNPQSGSEHRVAHTLVVPEEQLMTTHTSVSMRSGRVQPRRVTSSRGAATPGTVGLQGHENHASADQRGAPLEA